MGDAVAELDEPYTIGGFKTWFAERYPKIKPGTVQAHVLGMAANHPSRHHYASLASKPPLLYRIGPGEFLRYDPDLHAGSETQPPRDVGADEDAAFLATEEQAEFVLEAHLEEFLLGNWERIDWGRPLALWKGSAGQVGHQVITPVGRIDLLCVDTKTGALVVIELKRGRPGDRVVGQIARYLGWVRVHLAEPGQQVEGVIVAHETDDSLAYAASAVPGVGLMTYEVNFELKPAALPGPGSATASF